MTAQKWMEVGGEILADLDLLDSWDMVDKPFKQCTTTSNSPFASSASSSSVQMLLESNAEKDLTWFSSAIVLTTVETYSMSGDARWRALSCWMMDSTWAMASWERRVPMLILVMGLLLVVMVLLLVGSDGEDTAAMFCYFWEVLDPPR
jgi:hypothetical protein